MTKSLFDYTVKDASDLPHPLSQYKGKVVLVVNVASLCALTPQYKQLESLRKEYEDRGLVVLGFPCNQFGSQEPGSNADIQSFCELSYGVSFPVLAKVDVNGDAAEPVFGFLKEAAPGLLGSKAVKWNFTKFLIDRSGQPLGRYASTTGPEKISRDIEKALEM